MSLTTMGGLMCSTFSAGVPSAFSVGATGAGAGAGTEPGTMGSAVGVGGVIAGTAVPGALCAGRETRVEIRSTTTALGAATTGAGLATGAAGAGAAGGFLPMVAHGLTGAFLAGAAGLSSLMSETATFGSATGLGATGGGVTGVGSGAAAGVLAAAADFADGRTGTYRTRAGRTGSGTLAGGRIFRGGARAGHEQDKSGKGLIKTVWAEPAAVCMASDA